MSNIKHSLKNSNLAASKNRGQNFLIDPNIINKIASNILPDPPNSDFVVEIGPGMGALTKAILKEDIARLWAIEFDQGLAERLKQTESSEKLEIIRQDVLKFDPATLPAGQEYILCGNLPYNISTPILFWYLRHQKYFKYAVFMLQTEMADRLLAKPNTKAYGRLTVALGLYNNISKLMKIAPTAFFPRPKVESTLIKFIPKKNLFSIEQDKLAKLTLAAFAGRRKTILNNLINSYGKETSIKALEKLGIDAGLRPENLELEQFALLCQELES